MRGLSIPRPCAYDDALAAVAALPDGDAPALFGLPDNIERSVQRTQSAHAADQLRARCGVYAPDQRRDVDRGAHVRTRSTRRRRGRGARSRASLCSCTRACDFGRVAEAHKRRPSRSRGAARSDSTARSGARSSRRFSNSGLPSSTSTRPLQSVSHRPNSWRNESRTSRRLLRPRSERSAKRGVGEPSAKRGVGERSAKLATLRGTRSCLARRGSSPAASTEYRYRRRYSRFSLARHR